MATKLEDIIKKTKERANKDFKDRPVRPPEGKSIWRILPGWNSKDPMVFFHAFGQHYIKNTDGKIRAVIGCNDRTYDKSCEICDMVGDAIKSAPDDETRKAIKDMNAGQTYLVNAVQVDKDKTKPVLLQFSKKLFEGSLMDALSEYGAEMLDLKEGNDIIITREGKGLDTKYTLTVRSQAKSTPIDDSVFSQVIDLDEYVKDDMESQKAKAIEAIGGHLGELPSVTGGYGGPGTSGALEDKTVKGLGDDDEDDANDLDDDLGGHDGETIDGTAAEVKEPDEKEKAKAESTFNDDIKDEDLDAILAQI